MCLLDCIKRKNSKSFSKKAKKQIEHLQFSCFISKPFFYLYSLELMNEELKKDNLYISKVTKILFKKVFTVTRL